MLNNLPYIKHLQSNSFFLIAGPCVVEDETTVFTIAEKIKTTTDKLKIPYIFKASYKKANRSRHDSFTGIGDEEALRLLEKVKESLEIPVLTDIHSVDEVFRTSRYVDILQIPAFLCRQTEILIAAAKTGKLVNIKKGQFMAPASMKYAIDKVKLSGNENVMITERGTTFGYSDLIVDYRGIHEMKQFGVPVILDITHSLQQPNQQGGVTGGRPGLIETIARAGIAVGVDGLFIETHPDPSSAKSDGANMLPLDRLDNLLINLSALRKTVNTLG